MDAHLTAEVSSLRGVVRRWWRWLLREPRAGVAYALLLCIVLVGAWLRLRNLGAESLWLDEAYSWWQSNGTLADLIARTAADNYPPFHNLLLYAFMKVTGSDAEWVLRLPSALLGIASLGAVYWLGSLVGGRATGVVAAALLVASSKHIYYSQEARGYALMVLGATLYAASALHFVKSPTASRAALVAGCGLALLYSHTFGVLNWIAIGGGISVLILLTPAFSRRSLLLWVGANVAAGLGFLPWALVLLGRAGAIAGNFWIPDPDATYVYRHLTALVGGPATAIVLIVGATIGFRANGRAAAILLGWWLGPIVASLVVSVLFTPIFFNRYLIGGLPAAVTLGALGIVWLARRPWWPAAVVAAALLGTAVVENLRVVPVPRTNWRQVMVRLEERLKDTDCILVYPSYSITPLRYYLRRPVCTVLPDPIDAVDLGASGASRVFAIYAEPEFGPLWDKLNAFGRRGAYMQVGKITIVEYRRAQ